MTTKMPDVRVSPATTLEQRAYIAGFFDGDSTLYATYRKRGNTYVVTAKIRQRVDRDAPVRLIHELYGGNFRVVAREAPRADNSQCELVNNRAAAFLSDILPHLRLRHEKASLALELLSRLTSRWNQSVSDEENEIRAQLAQRLNALNKAADGRSGLARELNRESIESRAYIAGFLEADGMIAAYYNKTTQGHQVQVCFTQKDPLILRALQQLYGGSISPEAWSPGRVPQLHIVNTYAKTLLQDVQPYLTTKREHALIALRLQNRKALPKMGKHLPPGEKELRSGLIAQLRLLNLKGVKGVEARRQLEPSVRGEI